MKLIKNGKMVLNGKYTEQELEDKLLTALEIIVDKKVNTWCVCWAELEEYNTKYVNQEWRRLTEEEYKLLKEIAQ